MSGTATFPPASLTLQLAELEREKKMRAGVYPHWIATGKIKQAVADYQSNALEGAIATIRRLAEAQARGEPGRKELIEALRKLAIAKTVRMAHGGGTVPNGGFCQLCKASWEEGEAPRHEPECILAKVPE